MKPFVIGLAVAIVILAAGFLTPAFLPRATGPSTLEALREAELARRQLYAYNATLPLVAARGDVEQLEQADFDDLVERSQDKFAELSTEFNRRVREAKARDREGHLPESPLRAVATSASGLKAAVSNFEKFLGENRKLLDDAVKNSRSANQADRNALSVGQVAGTAKLVEAAGLLAQARQLRSQLKVKQTRALAVAAEWATVRAERNHYAGLDVTTIRKDLGADLGEIESALAQAQTQVNELTRAVADREQTLARLRADLQHTRAERLGLEEMGFTVGDDASYEAYRERYVQLSQRLQELQNQEHLLAFGGIRGGSAADGDLLEGEIEGGETVVGLNELQRRLAIAADKLERYTRGRKALEDKIGLVDTVGEEAQAQGAQYAARLERLTAEVNQIREAMAKLAQQAFEREDAALRAAREAASAFKGAKSAVDRWISDASALQREDDPQRTNERLKLIVRDNVAADFATNAEAQANTLVGRIHTERALGLAAYLDALRRISELTGTELDAAELQESFNTARDEATSVLAEARDAYERLAQKKTDTSWVHQASLAVVYHLLWQIDEFNAERHRSNLIDELGKVIANSQQFPYLQRQVALYMLLTGGMEPVQPGLDEEDEEPGDEEPADEDEEE
ncbi:MAG: hypothetical protein ACE5I3_13030 [Phycisphaerae bacterium]